jgi:Rho GTPase-activating protein 1
MLQICWFLLFTYCELTEENISKNETIKAIFNEDIHVVSSLLKLFFRDLESPIFPNTLYTHMKEIERFPLRHLNEPVSENCIDTDGARIIFIRTELFAKLPNPVITLLAHLFSLLRDISKQESQNLMSSQNLAIVWSPNFVKSGNVVQDLAICAVKSAQVTPPASSTEDVQPAQRKFKKDAPVASFSRLLTGGGAVGMVVFLCIERYDEVFEGYL